MVLKKTTKYPTMTREQEMKDALKAIRGYERAKKAGRLKLIKNVSDIFDENDNL